jgi:hypothetical protein
MHTSFPECSDIMNMNFDVAFYYYSRKIFICRTETIWQHDHSPHWIFSTVLAHRRIENAFCNITRWNSAAVYSELTFASTIYIQRIEKYGLTLDANFNFLTYYHNVVYIKFPWHWMFIQCYVTRCVNWWCRTVLLGHRHGTATRCRWCSSGRNCQLEHDMIFRLLIFSS